MSWLGVLVLGFLLVGCCHNTVTVQVDIRSCHPAPPAHQGPVQRLEERLEHRQPQESP